jgi:hypothetical protein
MSLLRTAVRCAIAAAAAGAASSAFALDISNYDSSVVNVKISGSTALDNTIVNSAIETAAPGGMCNVSGVAGSGGTNTVDIYFVGTTASFTNRVIFCNASGNSGITAGTKIAIFKESAVGSANGVQPLINAAKNVASTVNFINPALISDAVCATSNQVNATGNFGAYTQHSGCPTADVVANDIPTVGVADVEASILLTAAGAPISASDTAAFLKATPTVDQIWTIPLTKNAYYALQAAEGFTSPSDLPANAPTLTKSEVAGLLTANVFGWSQLGLAPADDTVYICRRDKGSGTEASFEAYFAGQRCSLSSLTIPQEDTAVVFANGSGGAMRTCLQHVFAGGVQTGFYSGTTHTFAGGGYGIGLLNTELTAANLSGAGDAYRLIAVDGSGPLVENVTNGFYPYFSTGNAYQIVAGSHIPSGNAALATNQFVKLLGQPAFLADSNKAYGSAPWTIANGTQMGDAAPAGNLPVPSVPATAATVALNPVNAYTKNSSGSINNCDTPVFDFADYATTPVPSKLLGNGNVNN